MAEQPAPQGAEKKAPQGASKARAAQGEKKSRKRTTEWRGVKLSLPAKLPAVVAFEFEALENDRDALGAVFRILTLVLGREQFQKVRDKLADDGDPIDDLVEIVNALMGDIFDQYGVETGEAQASAAS